MVAYLLKAIPAVLCNGPTSIQSDIQTDQDRLRELSAHLCKNSNLSSFRIFVFKMLYRPQEILMTPLRDNLLLSTVYGKETDG